MQSVPKQPRNEQQSVENQKQTPRFSASVKQTPTKTMAKHSVFDLLDTITTSAGIIRIWWFHVDGVDVPLIL